MKEAEFHAAIAATQGKLPLPRFAIYRNNVRAALITAIRVRYPMTARALGEAFVPLTADFVARHRPASPVLIDYGAHYPDTIETPWIADVARLESAWWQAYHAAEGEPLPAQSISGLGPEALFAAQFVFHPSLRLLQTATPAAANWQALIDGTPPAPTPETQHVLILRPEAEVTVRIIPADTFQFLLALQTPMTLGAAIAAAGGDFDLQGQLAHLLSGRLICGVHS